MADCLSKAKDAYKDIIDNAEIESAYAELEAHRQRALETGDDLYNALNDFAANKIRDREQANIASELQQLKNMQAVVDNLQRIETFGKAGYTNPIVKALKAKIAGSPYKIFRGRESTENKMVRARTTFERQFGNDINNDLAPLWNSLEYQTEIADSLMRLNRGEKMGDSPFDRLAEITKKYQVKLNAARRALGIDISELEDRISPNVHSQAKMMKLSRAERKLIKDTGQKPYDYLFNRWRDFIYPLLDKVRTFTNHNIDPNDKMAVSEFLKNAFDNLTNRGKITQEKINFANRIKQPRVLHWQDGPSIVKYNENFGTGALQDSITRELSFGFGNLELMKDWGISPTQTLERTFKILEENPVYKDRFNKGKEFDSLNRLLRGLTRNDADFGGAIDEVARWLKSWQVVTKLGHVVVKSLPDLGLLAEMASKQKIPAYKAIGGAIKNFTVGMGQAEREALKDLIDVGKQAQIGSIASFYESNFNPRSIPGTGVRWMFKLNGLHRWDFSLRGQSNSILARYFAHNRNIPWEKLTAEDQNIFNLYDISKEDWNVIRQSDLKVADGKSYITPDAVQSISDEKIIEALKAKGVSKITRTRIDGMKNDIENKLRDYFQDRQDHVILRPGVLDTNLVNFGLEPTNQYARAALGLFAQFKLYGAAFIRKAVFSRLYGKGARNFNEALWGAKADYVGVAKLGLYMGALSYASMSLENLLLNQTPPSLNSKKTWLNILQDSLGFYGMVLRLDPNDLQGSLARAVMGPNAQDLSNIVKFGYHALGDLATGQGFDSTKRAWYGLAHNNIPLIKQAYTGLVLNNLLFNEWQDAASPGKRQKYMQQLEQDQGVTQIF